MVATPIPGQPLLWLSGNVDWRIEVDTGLDPTSGGVYDTALYDQDIYGSVDAAWFDISEFVESIDTHSGTERWGQRFQTGSMEVVVRNESGIFSPDSNAVTPWYLPFRPGRRIRAVVIPDPDAPDTKVPMFTGTIDSSNDQYDGAGFDLTTQINCVDFMGLLASFNPVAQVVGTGVQSTDERVIAALDVMDWSATDRDIQAGDHTMASSFLAQSTLEECQIAADAEGGHFYCSPDGFAVFKSRDWLTTDTRSTVVQYYVGYDDVAVAATAANMIDIETSWEVQRIKNHIEFARVGSTMQVVEDTASQSQYGRLSYPRTDYQNNTDAEVLFLAERHLAAYKDNRLHIDSVTITGNDDPDNLDLNRALWDCQLGDLVSVLVEPDFGWSYERQLNIMGISHHVDANDWVVTWELDDALSNALLGRQLLVPTLNPVAWYQFTEVGGTATNDATGDPHDLTWAGGAVLTGTGGPNGAGLVDLDGTNDVATVANEADLELRQDMSIEFWVKPDDATGSEQAIFTCRGTGADAPLYEIYYDPGFNRLRFYPSSAATSRDTPGHDVPEGVWIHVVVTVDWGATTRDITWYYNGVWVRGPNTYSYLPGVLARAVNIGRRATANDLYFDGSLAELVIYDRVLSAAEVTDLYNAAYP